MSGSPSTATPFQLSPPIYPPGYGFSDSFFNNTLPGVMNQPYPTYPGQLDPGMSPTAANALRQAQDYSQSPMPGIFGAAAGSIGQFMNPNYLDPQGGQNRDYGFNYDFSDPYRPYTPPPSWTQPPQYGAPQPYGNDMLAAPGSSRPPGGAGAGAMPNFSLAQPGGGSLPYQRPDTTWQGAPPGVSITDVMRMYGQQGGGQPAGRLAQPGGGLSSVTGQSRGRTNLPGPEGLIPPAHQGGDGGPVTQDDLQPRGPFSRRPSPGVGLDQGGGGGVAGGSGGGSSSPSGTAPAAGAGSGIGLSEILQGAGLLGGLLGGGGGGGGGVNFQGGGGGRPAPANLPPLNMGYQPMQGGQGFLPFAPGSSDMSLTAGVGASSVRPGGAGGPGGGGMGAGGGPAGGLPMPGTNWTNTSDPLSIIPQGQLPWLGRWTGPNKGKSEEEVHFDMWTRGWPMGEGYQPPAHLVEAARAAGQPVEFGSRQTQMNETPGFYRGYESPAGGAPPPAPSGPSPMLPSGGGVSGRPVGQPIPAGGGMSRATGSQPAGGGLSSVTGQSSVRPGGATPSGASPGLRLALPGGGSPSPPLNMSVPSGGGAPPSLRVDQPAGGMPSPSMPGGGMPMPGNQPPSDPFSGPTSAMDVYRSAVPVMQQDMQNRISDAMAGAGFSGNRFSSSAKNTAGQIGADTGLKQNQLFTNLLYNQTQTDLDRAQRSIDQGMTWTGLQDQLAQNRIRLPFEMGQWEQGRQDMFSGQAFQDWSQNRLGWLPMLLQAAQSQGGTPTSPQFGSQQTAGSPGALDYFSALAPLFTAYFQNR